MTHRADVAHGRDVVARWCALAEARLEHLTELFDTGRWRRYHSELAFLENIQEARSAVEIWRDLSTREASRNNSAIDMSWLGHTQATLARDETLRGQADPNQPPPAQIPVEPMTHVASLSAETELALSDEAPSAPDSDISDSGAPVLDAPVFDAPVFDAPVFDVPVLDAPALEDVAELTRNIAAMHERYPLLRNAL